jgi:hypothetical protein
VLLHHTSSQNYGFKRKGTTNVPVGVNAFNGVIERVHVLACEHWGEDLLLVDLHVGGDVGEHGGAHPAASFVPVLVRVHNAVEVLKNVSNQVEAGSCTSVYWFQELSAGRSSVCCN